VFSVFVFSYVGASLAPSGFPGLEIATSCLQDSQIHINSEEENSRRYNPPTEDEKCRSNPEERPSLAGESTNLEAVCGHGVS
jgi:hypothetical protein